MPLARKAGGTGLRACRTRAVHRVTGPVPAVWALCVGLALVAPRGTGGQVDQPAHRAWFGGGVPLSPELDPFLQKMAVVGGEGSGGACLGDAWAVQPDSLEWEPLGAGLPTARANHSVASAPGGRVYAFGGTDCAGALYGDLWMYDGAGEWVLRHDEDLGVPNPPAPSPRAGGAMATVSDPEFDGAVVVLHGGLGGDGAPSVDELWVFFDRPGLEPAWVERPPVEGSPAPTPRAYHTATAVGSQVWMFGGLSPNRPPGGTTGELYGGRELWVFNPGLWMWQDASTLVPTAIPPRANHAAASADGRFLIVYGGTSISSGEPLNDLWMFDTDRGEFKWSSFTALLPSGAPPVAAPAVGVYTPLMVIYGGAVAGGAVDTGGARKGDVGPVLYPSLYRVITEDGTGDGQPPDGEGEGGGVKTASNVLTISVGATGIVLLVGVAVWMWFCGRRGPCAKCWDSMLRCCGVDVESRPTHGGWGERPAARPFRGSVGADDAVVPPTLPGAAWAEGAGGRGGGRRPGAVEAGAASPPPGGGRGRGRSSQAVHAEEGGGGKRGKPKKSRSARRRDKEEMESRPDNKVCAICLARLGYKPHDDTVSLLEPEVAWLPCTHGFHQRCFDEWAKDHASCPTCRAPVPEALVPKQKKPKGEAGQGRGGTPPAMMMMAPMGPMVMQGGGGAVMIPPGGGRPAPGPEGAQLTVWNAPM